MQVQLYAGVSPLHRAAAAALYWQAFSDKLGRVMGPEPRALAYLERVLRPQHCLTAVTPEGALAGLAGYRTAQGGFTSGRFEDLRRVYGLGGALWRAILLRLLSQDVDNQRFLVDGIVVGEAMRGQGIGLQLIEALCDEARRRGYGEIRLDVADINPRARALYERAGFTAIGTDRMGWLAPVFNFSSSTRMVRRLG
ncbi:GNAT family N-acetyltransferase [Thioclava sp. BHET1]|nr:GNAT family N-acetyltransferase [Thioclava sp. BHET1]